MAKQAGKVYGSAEEMISGVAKETGLKPEDVRKVLHASFASTKDFILGEIARAQAEAQKAGKAGKAGKDLSDADLDQVSGGLLSSQLYSYPGISAFSQYYKTPSLIEKIGSLGV